MIKQGFNIGTRDWYIMAYYNVHTDKELSEVADILRSVYCSASDITKAVRVLSEPNHGYTFTNFDEHLTLMFMSKATSAEQMYAGLKAATWRQTLWMNAASSSFATSTSTPTRPPPWM